MSLKDSPSVSRKYAPSFKTSNCPFPKNIFAICPAFACVMVTSKVVYLWVPPTHSSRHSGT
ncbi:hypothetical protein DPMN_040016 [Dreissena polymorpha]|uniref:Uncharacterized protein n=1 Tax=Dreissena polymorpha TaxID=45954 RepID=A0A9D4HSN1_DREPO|nr:hypothetical protein DPMN_040016 [Dreissena polymorpha]